MQRRDSGRRAPYLPLSAREDYEAEDGVQVGVRRTVPAEEARQLERVGDHAECDLHHVQDEQREAHLFVGVFVLAEPVRRRRLPPIGPADEDHGPGDDQLDDRVRVEPSTSEWASNIQRAPSRHSLVGQRPRVPRYQRPNRKQDEEADRAENGMVPRPFLNVREWDVEGIRHYG